MNLLEITNIMFKDREKWSSVTAQDKIKNSFIINRFFSKKEPELAQSLNFKNTDPVIVMDTWFHYMQNKPYPKWFWSKSKKKTDKLTNEDRLMMEQFSLDRMSMDFLKNNFEKEYKQELKLIKTRFKNGKK